MLKYTENDCILKYNNSNQLFPTHAEAFKCGRWTNISQRALRSHLCADSGQYLVVGRQNKWKKECQEWSMQTSWTELCVQICLRECNFLKANHVSCSVRTLWVKCLVVFGWAWVRLGWVRLHAIISGFWETTSWKGGCNCSDDEKMMNLEQRRTMTQYLLTDFQL